MTITPLDKIIQKRAEKKFEESYIALLDYIRKNPIGKRLKIKVGTNKYVPLAESQDNDSLLGNGLRTVNNYNDTNNETNFVQIKKELIEFYMQEESKILLEKIDYLGEYFLNNTVEKGDLGCLS